VISHGNRRAQGWTGFKRLLSSLRTRTDTFEAENEQDDGVQNLRRSVDQLRTTVEALSGRLTSVEQTSEGHAAWLSDLQTWMSSCVQMLNTLSDVPPISSARVQASGPPARRRDDVEEIKRQVRIWTTMAWLDQAVVPSDRLISVIMPTRNRSGWIGRAIASIQAQEYGHWELVVVDDYSSDDTAFLLTKTAAGDERIRYHRIEHAGAPAARNVGLASATGDIVCYLDDDNIMHPGWLKAVAWAFSCWPETEVLYGARIIEDDMAQAGTRSGNLPSIRFRAWDRRRLESSNFIDQNVIAHRAGLPEAHFDEALPMCQDWDLMLRMTARQAPLELPVLACLYSTTAPNRGSEQPDQVDPLHRVRARAHMGRPLRLLVLGRRPEDVHGGRIETDMVSFAQEGAYIAFAEPPLSASGPEVETETGRFVAAVTEHDPDVVLVYGVATAVELDAPLEAAGRPFAVRAMEGPDDAEGLLGHSLLLGLWIVPEQSMTGSAANFLEELSERLRIWKLDTSEG
jgi:hypothetical protein